MGRNNGIIKKYVNRRSHGIFCKYHNGTNRGAYFIGGRRGAQLCGKMDRRQADIAVKIAGLCVVIAGFVMIFI